jgi:hypothetical protein
MDTDAAKAKGTIYMASFINNGVRLAYSVQG